MRAPTPTSVMRSAAQCSISPARMRFSIYSRLRFSMMIELDAPHVQKPRQHQAGGARSDDADLRAHDYSPGRNVLSRRL